MPRIYVCQSCGMLRTRNVCHFCVLFARHASR